MQSPHVRYFWHVADIISMSLRKKLSFVFKVISSDKVENQPVVEVTVIVSLLWTLDNIGTERFIIWLVMLSNVNFEVLKDATPEVKYSEVPVSMAKGRSDPVCANPDEIFNVMNANKTAGNWQKMLS